jgi:hypothetical protein
VFISFLSIYIQLLTGEEGRFCQKKTSQLKWKGPKKRQKEVFLKIEKSLILMHYRGVETTRCIHHRGVVLDTGGRFTDFQEHTTIFKENIIQKIGSRLL